MKKQFINLRLLAIGAIISCLMSFNAQAQKINAMKAEFRLYYLKDNKEFIKGNFGNVNGNISFDANNLWAAFFDVSLDVASINSGSPKKDSLLKSSRFFNAALYPNIKFTSTRVYQDSSEQQPVYKVDGKLTIKNITQPVTIRFNSFHNSGATVFKGRLDLDRKTYQLMAPPGTSDYVYIYIEAAVE